MAKNNKPYKLGIALGGGGTRGFAHLGVVKALAEMGLVPDVYAGTSAGSIAGAFLASGLDADKVFELMHRNKLSDYTKIHLPIDGLMSLDGMNEKITTHIQAEKIEELEKPFYVTVSNINSGCVEYHHKGRISDLVLASSSIPVLFSPKQIDAFQYVDGGVFDNVPVAAIRDVCEFVIGVNIMPVEPAPKVKNLMEVALRTFQLSVESNTAKSRQLADYFIEPMGISKFGILNPAHAKELFELGYQHTKKLKIAELQRIGARLIY